VWWVVLPPSTAYDFIGELTPKDIRAVSLKVIAAAIVTPDARRHRIQGC
jgi:hypothetical protein